MLNSVSSWPSLIYCYCSSLVMHEIIEKKKKKWSWCGFGKKYQPLWAKWVIRSQVQFEPLAPRKLDVELGLAMCTYTHLGIVANTLLPTSSQPWIYGNYNKVILLLNRCFLQNMKRYTPLELWIQLIHTTWYCLIADGNLEKLSTHLGTPPMPVSRLVMYK